MPRNVGLLRAVAGVAALVAALALLWLPASAATRSMPHIDKMRIPEAMKQKVKETQELQSVKRFVESSKAIGFFENTDKTFATYLASHPRFFALFYAPFSTECTEFFTGYKQAAESLVAQGYAANLTVRRLGAFVLPTGVAS
jgi:hypothetical protein